MQKIGAFIFDMDGVIIDSEPIHSRVKLDTFAHFGIPFRAEDLARYMGRTSGAIFRDALAACGRQDIKPEDMAAYKHAHYLEVIERDGIETIPGSLALIERLHAAGVPLALATSSWRRVVDTVLSALQLEDVFASVISGTELPASKPDPAIYEKSAEALGASPAACVVLEDTAAGVLAAKRAGMYCIGFRSPHSGAQDLSRADRIVDDLNAIDIGKL